MTGRATWESHDNQLRRETHNIMGARLRNLLPRWSEPELAAVDRLEAAFGQLTIVDDKSDGPHLSAVAAYELIGGDDDPIRVRLIVNQVRNRRERKALLRQLGADSLHRNNGRNGQGPRAA